MYDLLLGGVERKEEDTLSVDSIARERIPELIFIGTCC